MNQVAIGSFNLLNLRLPNKPFYGTKGYSKHEYQRKTDWTASILDALKCQVIGVQEVFDRQALQACVAASKTMSEAAVVIAPHATAQNKLPRVGLIAMQPLLGPVKSIKQIPASAVVTLPGAPEIGLPDQVHQTFSRPILTTTINLGSTDAPVPAKIYVVHLKSRRPKTIGRSNSRGTEREDLDDPSIESRAHLRALMMRAAEATGLRQLLLTDLVGSRMPVIVLGDFNDHAKAMTTALISGRIYAKQLARRDYTLWHAAALQRPNVLKRNVGYTKIHLGEPDSIDHILLSEEFLRDGRHAIGEVLRVDWFNDHLNDRDVAHSDHGAIRATLQLKQPAASRDVPAAKARRQNKSKH